MSVIEYEPRSSPREKSRLAWLGHPLVLVGLMTLLGAGLRFMYLTRPALWGDEVATFRRVCSDFQFLVDQLAGAGLFTPLHYLLYWWIGQHTPLTPFMMRLPVAIAGTLMVPAMYFLAVQLVSKRTALVVTLFTACSAYLLNYSRDAKMYMDTWLFVTLNVACLLWWLRTRSRVSWWAWVCSGVIMAGLQAVAMAILPIELIIVLTARNANWKSLGTLLYGIAMAPIAFGLDVLACGGVKRAGKPGSSVRWFQRTFANFRWPPILFFAIGAAIILIGPYFYYTRFSTKAERVYEPESEQWNWSETGIGWVDLYNRGRDGWDLLRYTSTAFAYSWEWPKLLDEPMIRERTLKLLKGSAIGLAALLALGVLPWRAWRRRGIELHDAPRSSSAVWLAAWIVLPAYGWYCASQKNALWPIDWGASLLLRDPPRVPVSLAPDGLPWHHQLGTQLVNVASADWIEPWRGALTADNVRWWLVIALATALLAWTVMLCFDFRRQSRIALAALGAAVLLLVACTIIRIAIPKPFERSVWMPRYLGFVWPAFAIAVCALLMRLPTRPLRWGAIALLLVVNLSQHWARVFAGSEPPVHQMAADIVGSQPPSESRCYVDFGLRGPEPGQGALFSPCGRYYLSILSGKPAAPDELLRGFERNFEIWTSRIVPPFEMYVANTMQNAPSINRIIMWDNLRPGQVRTTDGIAEKLSGQWKLVSSEEHHVRDHWTWKDLITARRRVYERKPAPSTPPTRSTTSFVSP